MLENINELLLFNWADWRSVIETYYNYI